MCRNNARTALVTKKFVEKQEERSEFSAKLVCTIGTLELNSAGEQLWVLGRKDYAN